MCNKMLLAAGALILAGNSLSSIAGQMPPRPMVIAHRGARSVAPENTLQAFDKAVRVFKAPMIELDVHLSSDGVPVVFHDDSLLRCTDAEAKFPGRGDYLIGEFTYLELVSLDAGSWFVETDPFKTVASGEVSPEEAAVYTSGAIRIPTLEAALTLAQELGCMVNVEIKNHPSYYEGVEEKVVSLIRKTGMTGKVILSSFDHRTLLRCSALASEIPTAALCEQPIAGLKCYVRDFLGSVAWNPGANVIGSESISYRSRGLLRTDMIKEAHDAGLKVFVWTVNDPALLGAMADSGVDGIFTDFPQRFQKPGR